MRVQQTESQDLESKHDLYRSRPSRPIGAHTLTAFYHLYSKSMRTLVIMEV